jgi:hypothetical protein
LLSRVGGWPLLAALLVAGGLASAPTLAQAKPAPSAAAGLSPRLAELAKPAVRSLSRAGQAARLDIAVSGPGSLLREGNRVLADVRFGGGAVARLDDLQEAGARIVSVSRRYQTVTVAVSPGSVRQVAGVAGVELVRENRAPLVFASGGASTAQVGANCEGGSIVSEGVAHLRAATARSKYDVSGGGVTVGVLSDSFDQASPVATHAGDDVASSDLPGSANPCLAETTPVEVLQDFGSAQGYEATDEGRAMLQVVHDVAPGAALAFATAFESETSFAENIELLAKPPAGGGAGADVIVDDVAWFEEPFFQDGPVAAAVNKVTADGVAYFSSAGNNNLIDSMGRDIASWEAPQYRDSGVCPAALGVLSPVFNASHCLDFKQGAGTDTTFAIQVSAGATLTLDLQWAESWYGVGTDLDAFLLDDGSGIVAASFEENSGDPGDGATQRPVELLQWENGGVSTETVRLVVNRFAGGVPRLKVALLQNGGGVTGTEYPASSGGPGGDVVGPTIFGHSGAAGAVSVGAISYQTVAQPEPYSSRGPVTHYFGPVSGTIAAAALPLAESIPKPDLVATDCGATTFFASLQAGEWRFCGTSAAAPHAAAVAALQLEAESAATPAEIRDAQKGTARTIPGFAPTAVGAGLLDADAAVASLLPPALVTITGFPSSRTADSTPTFSFEADPPASSFTCSIDGALAQPCGSPYTVPSPLSDGPHLFEVNALEAPSTVLDTASFAFTVDTSPPAITLTRRPAAVSADANPSFGFLANEPAALTCSVDGAAAADCDSSYVASALPDGSHTFRVTATDQVGNSSQVAVDFAIDTVAPELRLTEQPAGESANRAPRFGFLANEPAGFTCLLDGSRSGCVSPFVAPSPLADGSHGFEVTATDPAGNVGRLSTFFTIDGRRPQTVILRRPPKVLLTRRARARAGFRFGSDEPGSSFVCKLDRGAPKPCGARFSARLAPGGHRIEVRAQDRVGNVDATPAVFRFRVKRID